MEITISHARIKGADLFISFLRDVTEKVEFQKQILLATPQLSAQPLT